MYLWKYWRETRIVFGASLFLIALLFERVLLDHTASDPRGSLDQLEILLPSLLIFQAVPISLLGWLMGSFGIGRDCGEGCGSYLLSRPRSRGYFVWRDWGFGLAQLLPIVVLLNLALGFHIYRLLTSAAGRFHGSLVLSGRPVTLTSIVCLNCLAAFLLVGLVFSLTYFSTVILKHLRGVILGAGLLLGYFLLGAFVEMGWPAVHLPSLMLSIRPEFVPAVRLEAGGTSLIFVLSATARAIIVVLFPLAAQFVLQKGDVG